MYSIIIFEFRSRTYFSKQTNYLAKIQQLSDWRSLISCHAKYFIKQHKVNPSLLYILPSNQNRNPPITAISLLKQITNSLISMLSKKEKKNCSLVLNH